MKQHRGALIGLATGLFVCPLTIAAQDLSYILREKPAEIKALSSIQQSSSQQSSNQQFAAISAVSDPNGPVGIGSRLPQQFPIRPKPKPDPNLIPTGKDNDLIIPWVVPSKKFKATRAEVGVPGNMYCALTFDDGPHPSLDYKILSILKREGVIATFYLVGAKTRAHPKVARAIRDAGHEIGHHSWTHKNYKKMSSAAIRKDMQRAFDTIGEIASPPTVFRPPYGNYTKTTTSYAKGLGMETLLWTVDSLDWKKVGPSWITNRVVSRTKPGAVILLHSIQRKTVAALPAMIKGLKKKGCRFITSSDWLKRVT